MEKVDELGDKWKRSAEDGGCDLGDAASINVSERFGEVQTGALGANIRPHPMLEP